MQAQDDGDPSEWPLLYLWRHPVVACKHYRARLHTEEEVTERACHFVREGVANDEWRTSYVNTHENEADLLTKLLSIGEKRRGFVRNLLHNIYRS
jgi:hypothetical protein